MQISSSLQSTLTKTTLYQADRMQAVKTTAAPDAGSFDSVQFSPDALLLSEATRTAQNAPDIRQEAVEKLRIQVANGSYKPDSRLIAENLVNDAAFCV
ncbi:MAG: flagellar biosynthesis anti-sigma factor FlgM [Desulfovibrio sp.]|nr:flagellar biosynthesis anti-sigma factor FlgM [Desulfovibrio sp.]